METVSERSERPMETVSERSHRRPVTPARVDAVAEARTLAHALVGCDGDDATFRRVETLLAEANGLLAAVPHLPRAAFDPAVMGQAVMGQAETGRMSDEPDGPHLQAMADRAVAGLANPTSVEITSRIVPGGAEADVVFGPAFEGAPGRVHGGMVAAVFDDLLGAGMAQTRSIGFTGRLTVHYRAPVPIETMIRFQVLTGAHEGRKLHIHGDARLGDRVLASADALMILVDPEHFKIHARELLARGSGGK